MNTSHRSAFSSQYYRHLGNDILKQAGLASRGNLEDIQDALKQVHDNEAASYFLDELALEDSEARYDGLIDLATGSQALDCDMTFENDDYF